MIESRDIPEDVKRVLRQESGFGCCNCGVPIIDYHHIVPWEEDHHFRPEDMMCLCPTCHRKFGNTPKIKQYEKKNAPFNKTHGRTTGELTHHHFDTTVLIGTNLFVSTPVILRYHDEDLLSLSISENGDLQLDAKIYDSKDNLLVEIKRNEWKSYNDYIWDIIHRPYYL